ncbi:hypothetical protein PR001_g2751 [Phytophthora rubi]|uniref:Uncharacterized protein n=1 Tax=Phytophthora rubi TaxID=129364 RepID=A0A6A3P1C6_9STRA|nr:hypothetical protein PR002_g1041 [Phytophthora rubi]KAE9050047.1 hypothetical protein PR001_g2751 [Phytophthora rubi]
MAVSQPVCDFIQAPKLEGWSKAAIVKCGESLAKALASVKESFDPKLLEVVGLYELQTTVEEVTEDQLVKLITELTNNAMNEFIPDLDGVFRKKSQDGLEGGRHRRPGPEVLPRLL